MSIIEEKTPKGYIIKINISKLTFIAFDRMGATVYADKDQIEAIHQVRHILFFGPQFLLKRRVLGEYNLLKVSKNRILIPYYISGNKDLHYHLYPSNEAIDMIPVKIVKIVSPLEFIRYIETGSKPDVIFIDKSINDTDLAIMQDRYVGGEYLSIDTDAEILVSQEEHEEDSDDYHNVNLNIMSANPVFLSIIHLQKMNLSSVRQLLLDFDLSSEQIEYMLTYINAILEKKDSQVLEKSRDKVEHLKVELLFYRHLLLKEIEKVKEIITALENDKMLSSFMTLLAKVTSLMEDENDLDMVDVQNMLYEKKEEFEGAVS